MDLLHILNDGKNEVADFIISNMADGNSIRVVDLEHDEISYEELVELIAGCDRVFSW